MLDSKLVFCMFYVTVHRFLARVQSPTCTTYEKFLLESIMVVLTPKFGITLSESLESRIVPLNSSLTSKEVGHRNWKIYLKASVKLIAIYVQTTDCWKKQTKLELFLIKKLSKYPVFFKRKSISDIRTVNWLISKIITQHSSLASLPLRSSVNAKIRVENDFESKNKSDFFVYRRVDFTLQVAR